MRAATLVGPACARGIALAVVGALAMGCASPKPKLYPNAKLQSVGAEAAEKDIEDCLKLADSADLNESKAGKVAKGTGTGAVVGGAGGAAAGAVTGSAGRGAGAGAAGGAAVGLVASLFKAKEPDPLYKNYVNICLAERGYQTIGWK